MSNLSIDEQINHLRELQSSRTRWFSQEERDRLDYLVHIQASRPNKLALASNKLSVVDAELPGKIVATANSEDIASEIVRRWNLTG